MLINWNDKEEIKKYVNELSCDLLKNCTWNVDYFYQVLKNKLDKLVENQEKQKFVELYNTILYFTTYFTVNIEFRNNLLKERALSNYTLIILFSLIEGLMQEKPYLDCINFLVLYKSEWVEAVKI